MIKRSWLISILLVAFIFLISSFSMLGCSQTKESSRPQEEASEETTTGETDEEAEDEQSDKQKVLMMGRSVMGGWFEYWDSDTSQPVEQGDFILYYKEVETPPDIVDSAKDYVDEIDDDKPIIFFKFCFDDFWAGDKSEAKANLSDNKKYIRQVYDAVAEDHGLKLIIGNALPKVKAYTDSDLVWNHRSFNKWLEEFANDHSGEVYIFDQYSVLTDSKGNLKSEYAIDREDSHLNENAYSALDEDFFDLLERNF